MASKLAAAGVIEGALTDEGLAAMSDCQDMTTVLARELAEGIRNEHAVEDSAASFKKMAILHEDSDEQIKPARPTKAVRAPNRLIQISPAEPVEQLMLWDMAG